MRLHWLAGTGTFPNRSLISRHKGEVIPYFDGFPLTQVLSLPGSSPLFNNWHLFTDFQSLAYLRAAIAEEFVQAWKASIVAIDHFNYVPLSTGDILEPPSTVASTIPAREVSGLQSPTIICAILHLAVPVVDILWVEEPVLAAAQRPIAAWLRDCGGLSTCKLLFCSRLGHVSTYLDNR